MQESEKVKLKKWPTLVKPVYQSKEQYQELLGEQVGIISSQSLLTQLLFFRPDSVQKEKVFCI